MKNELKIGDILTVTECHIISKLTHDIKDRTGYDHKLYICDVSKVIGTPERIDRVISIMEENILTLKDLRQKVIDRGIKE